MPAEAASIVPSRCSTFCNSVIRPSISKVDETPRYDLPLNFSRLLEVRIDDQSTE